MRCDALLTLLFLASSILLADAPPSTGSMGATQQAVENDWLTGSNISLGNVLFPHVHFQSVYGGTSAEELPEIGHHDPRMDEWTVQGFEFGMSGRFGEYFEGFSTLHVFYDRESESWGNEFEEWFGRIKNLPGDIELRGGRYLNRFGIHNSQHQHGWDFVDTTLVNGRFLGDDGLYTIGGEVDWKLPVAWNSHRSVSMVSTPER